MIAILLTHDRAIESGKKLISDKLNQSEAIYPKVSIIILNWNNWKDTLECLNSLFHISYPNYEVVLIDNGSKDDSIKIIKNYFNGLLDETLSSFERTYRKPIIIEEYSRDESERALLKTRLNQSSDKKIFLINNEYNLGFAEGNNIGIRYAFRAMDPDYVLLLNNDTVVHRDFLTELVEAAENDQKIGFVGPKVYYYNFNGRTDIINVAGSWLDIPRGRLIRIGAGEVDKGQYDVITEVDYVEGSCMLAKSKVLKEIGLLNSKYFAYWEETDLCRRGAEAGYKSLYIPKSRIWHKVGASSTNLFRLYHMTRNKLWFMKQHGKGKDLILFFLNFFGYTIWVTSGVYLRRGDTKSLITFFKGVLDGVIFNSK